MPIPISQAPKLPAMSVGCADDTAGRIHGHHQGVTHRPALRQPGVKQGGAPPSDVKVGCYITPKLSQLVPTN